MGSDFFPVSSGATLFQFATVAAALLVVIDYERRRDRYRELHRMMTQCDKQLELSQTWPIVLRITSVMEKALLAELIEWRSHIRHRKVPQERSGFVLTSPGGCPELL